MLRIYDEFLEDEDVTSLSHQAYRLHVSALVYCSRNLTDGDLTARALKVLHAILGYPLAKHIHELTKAGLWLKHEDGHQIRNYLEFNPNAETVKKEKAAARERMRKMREKRAAGSGERSGADSSGAGDSLPLQSLPVLAFEELNPRAVDVLHYDSNVIDIRNLIKSALEETTA